MKLSAYRLGCTVVAKMKQDVDNLSAFLFVDIILNKSHTLFNIVELNILSLKDFFNSQSTHQFVFLGSLLMCVFQM